MRKELLSGCVCGAYCRFYRPSKNEDLACMGFTIAERMFEDALPAALPEPPADKDNPEMPSDETAALLRRDLCRICPFAENDCDFSELQRQGASSVREAGTVPCGGFLFLGRLIDKKVIDGKDISQVIQD
jgi:hypothetical protein